MILTSLPPEDGAGHRIAGLLSPAGEEVRLAVPLIVARVSTAHREQRAIGYRVHFEGVSRPPYFVPFGYRLLALEEGDQ